MPQIFALTVSQKSCRVVQPILLSAAITVGTFWIAFFMAAPRTFEEQRKMFGSSAETVVFAYLGLLVGQVIFGYIADAIG